MQKLLEKRLTWWYNKHIFMKYKGEFNMNLFEIVAYAESAVATGAQGEVSPVMQSIVSFMPFIIYFLIVIVIIYYPSLPFDLFSSLPLSSS